MTDHELREMIRESIARHLGAAPEGPFAPPEVPSHIHASHGQFQVLRGGDGDGMCLIEPPQRCTHCSFCRSRGH